jgi:hypothetical protein
MRDIISQYIKQAQSILNRNWKGSFTVPSSSIYPHQWNWDSGFIAIGYSHYDTDRAVKELQSLFSAQWKNGMLPQIVFNRKALGRYFPEPDFWKTEVSPNAPDNYLTSGITMPPIHAVAVWKIYENATDQERVKPFLEWIYPRLLSYHWYLYRERNYYGDGLIYIRHPWESGMDNSPSWDGVLERINLSDVSLPEYERKDTSSGVASEMRPAKKHYDYFVYLLELFKKTGYDEREIAGECPFLVCGPLFNGILCAANEALIRISELLRKPYRDIEEWNALTVKSIREKLFHEDHGIFDAVDLRSGKLLEFETAAGFVPLFGGAATSKQAGRIYEYLNSKSFCALHQGNCFTVPSYDTEKDDFKRRNYWRGPVWININWMLMQGLRRYGFRQKADSLARNIIELPMRFGFYEYFDSLNGRGLGSKDFSWTAALFIDTAYENYIRAEQSAERAGKVRTIKTVVLNEFGTSQETGGVSISQQMMETIRTIKTKYYSEKGSVSYGYIRNSTEYRLYKKVAAALRDFDPACLTEENEKLAFWINLYNTIVVDGIIELNIENSVLEIRNFFSRLKYKIGSHYFSPDDIEHGILRANARRPYSPWKQFGMLDSRKKYSLRKIDPRIHFALVCGSRSCAPIRYYSPEEIDEELEIATKNFINSSEIIVIPEESRLLLSQIFKWYQTDFGGKKGVLKFIGKYILDDDKREFLEEKGMAAGIDYLYYDWHLNK